MIILFSSWIGNKEEAHHKRHRCLFCLFFFLWPLLCVNESGCTTKLYINMEFNVGATSRPFSQLLSVRSIFFLGSKLGI